MNYQEVMAQYHAGLRVPELEQRIAELEVRNSELEAENARLEAALAEAVELMRDAAEFLAPYGTSVAADLRAFLDKHSGEDECENG